MPPILAVGHVLANIVAQVAALAEVAKVGQVVVGFVVVEVRGGEHYPTPGDRVRSIVFCPAIGIRRRAFAAIARPLADGRDYFGEPVGGVFAVVDGHIRIILFAFALPRRGGLAILFPSWKIYRILRRQWWT